MTVDDENTTTEPEARARHHKTTRTSGMEATAALTESRNNNV